ncbi:MAG TPA: GxxExxY protein [Gemmatimonadaceae bacterium]|jgi:GxxExxY protein|nr:GxxExxY protein [Gemmatimonadaceae bacterium]
MKDIDRVTGQVLDSAMKVHSMLGPGLLESAYRLCLAHELRKRGFSVQLEVPLSIVYDSVTIDAGYRLDMLVDGQVLLELKAITKVIPIHEAQLLSYLKLGNYRVGMLINFHVRQLKNGITRLVNRL